jgi:hypothetical protein
LNGGTTAMDLNSPDQLKALLASGILGLFGALANVLYNSLKGRKVKVSYITFMLIIGFFVGNLVGSFIPLDFSYRDGFIMIAGFGCYNILNALEDKVVGLIMKIFDKKV